jgi:crossover junction endodeoxyribonuclease RusA
VHGRKRFADRPVQIKIAVRPPDRRKRDLDNVLKAILDAVEKAGVIDDDAQVRRLEVEFDEPVQDGQVTLVIAPLDTVARRG